MFRLRAKITYTPEPKRQSRIFRDVTKEAMHAGGEFWFDHLLPIHFTPAGRDRYDYRPRTEEHVARYGPQELVVSGDTETLALASRSTGIRAFPTRLRLTLATPKYIPQRPRSRKQPPMAEEIFAVSDDETKQIEAVEQTHAVKLLRRSGRPHTVRIG